MKKFTKKSKNEIEIEELLLDDSKNRLQFPINKIYLFIILGVAIFSLLFFLGTSFYYQYFKFQDYSQKALANSLESVFLEAPRGLISDKFNNNLADNQMFYDLVIVSSDFPKDQQGQTLIIETISKILNKNKDELLNLLNSKLLKGDNVLLENLTTEEAYKLFVQEESLTGLKIVGNFKRVYGFKEALSNVIGYTSFATVQDLNDNPELTSYDRIGRSGLEAFYDNKLRGTKGAINYQVNALQQVINQENEFGFKTGNSLKLTIDAQFQQKIYEVLSNYIGNRFGGASAVALNPQTGEVLALVTVPSYDNNLFSFALDEAELKKLNENPQKPFFNRTISGEYSPGSTIKPFIALMALEEKIISPLKEIDDENGMIIVENPYNPNKPQIFRDWQVHGKVNMAEAIAKSCDVYFYSIGGGYKDQIGLGVDKIESYLKDFNWGKTTGIDLFGEKPGLVPSRSWKEQELNDIWRIGDTYNLSIGQGYVRTTPLGLATNYSALINGGKILKPFIVKEIIDSETQKILQENNPQIVKQLNVDSQNLKIIQEGMELTTEIGTAKSYFSDFPIKVAGKSGSAQISSDLTKVNAWFVSYLPTDNPQILLVVLIESGGESGASATGVSREILDWYVINRMQLTNN